MVNKIILRIRLGCFSLKTVNGNDHNIYLIPLTDFIQSTAQALLLLCIQKARLVIQTAYGACPYRKSTCQSQKDRYQKCGYSFFHGIHLPTKPRSDTG